MSHRRDLNNDLSPQERTSLINLMLDFLNDSIVAEHTTIIHNDVHIFTGHRQYIERLENFLNSNGGGHFVPLPMWNPANPIPAEFNIVKARDNGTLRQPLANLNPNLPLPSQFAHPAVCQFSNGDDLGNAVNPWHGSVHIAIGGTMADFSNASAAPIFWCWHAFVDHIYWNWQNGCQNLLPFSRQSAWQPAWSPSATTRNPNNLDLFIVGNDGRVYTSWWYAGSDWSGINDNWRSLGGFFPPGAPVSAVARTPDILDLFVVGNDGRVYTSWWHVGSDWSGINDNWRSLGGFFPPGAPVSATTRNPNNLDLFVVGNDGRVYTSWWYAGSDWSGINDNWRSLGGFFPVGAPVSAVARTPDNLDLFIVGNDGRVYTSWWYAGSDWSGINDNWRSLGGFFPVGAPVSAVARTPDNLDLFIVGNDGRVYTSWWYAGSDWSGINDNWRSLGGFFPPSAPVSATTRNPNNLDLFVVGNDGRVYTSWWYAGSDWSGINDNWRSLGGFFPVPTE
jgi:hypothetical protein